jgi:hypothetical protein
MSPRSLMMHLCPDLLPSQHVHRYEDHAQRQQQAGGLKEADNAERGGGATSCMQTKTSQTG